MQSEQEKLYKALTPLQRQVADNVIKKGMSGVDAYKASKGKAKTENAIKSGASEILANPYVIAYMDSMRSSALKDTIMTREEALERLTRTARTSLSDLVEFGSYEVETTDGKKVKQSLWRIKDSAAQDPEKIAAISELSAGKDGLKIKTHSSLQAIKQISDMQGWNLQGDDGKEKDSDVRIHGGLPD
jgi:phage terminase small subunit